MTKKDVRYPYTYAGDLIRTIPNLTSDGVKLSRSEASKICSKIAKIIVMNDEELAGKLADYYLEHKKEINNAELNKMSEVINKVANRCLVPKK